MSGESRVGTLNDSITGERSRTLDILRCIAVLLVLGRHMEVAPVERQAVLHAITTVWHRGGWIGVDLFFVLSGYLVSGLLFREHVRSGTIRVKRFLVRRALKIYPPFYFLIACTAGYWLLRHGRLDFRAFSREMLFVQNYGRGMWNHTWSLAVEEHFYLALVALLLLLLWRNRASARAAFTHLPWLFAMMASVCLGMRLYVGRSLWSGSQEAGLLEHLLYPTHLRIDALFFGVVLSYYKHYRPELFAYIAGTYRWPLLFVGLACVVPAFAITLEDSWFLPTVGLSILYLGCGLLLWGLSTWEPKRSRVAAGFAFVGARSYSVYLWHSAVAVWGVAALRRVVPASNWELYATWYLLGTLVLGLSMSYLVELPILRLRERYFPGGAQPGPARRRAVRAPDLPGGSPLTSEYQLVSVAAAREIAAVDAVARGNGARAP